MPRTVMPSAPPLVPSRVSPPLRTGRPGAAAPRPPRWVRAIGVTAAFVVMEI